MSSVVVTVGAFVALPDPRYPEACEPEPKPEPLEAGKIDEAFAANPAEAAAEPCNPQKKSKSSITKHIQQLEN